MPNSNLTKAQCKREIARLDTLIAESYRTPWISISYVEQKAWWIERLGELIADEPVPFPGRKYRR